jgi:transposase
VVLGHLAWYEEGCYRQRSLKQVFQKEEAMKTAAAQIEECTVELVLHMALELANKSWKLGFSTGLGQKMRVRGIVAGDVVALGKEVAAAKRRFGLSPQTRVVSCYEAGRDGFWLHRHLESVGIENVVVDAGSMQVSRKKKGKRKTDRLDLRKLVPSLVRWHAGDKGVWSVVCVPSDEAEDARHPHRELEELKQERSRLSIRMQSFGKLHGMQLRVNRQFLKQLSEARRWDDSPLPSHLCARLQREFDRWQLVCTQIAQLEAQRRAVLAQDREDPAVQKVRDLIRLRAIGENSSWLYVSEMFGWRKFANRRGVGSLVGITPTPYDSGESERDLGIDHCGLSRVRGMTIQIAWCWVRYQPESDLTLWFKRRWGSASRRQRKVGIVALARKLIIALWRYLEFGIVPRGAVFNRTEG